MPYVQQSRRDLYKEEINSLVSKLKTVAFNPGDLNYIISNLIGEAYNAKPSYSTINSMVGALECCKHEMYLRIAAPHEFLKILENKDIPPYLEANNNLQEKIHNAKEGI